MNKFVKKILDNILLYSFVVSIIIHLLFFLINLQTSSLKRRKQKTKEKKIKAVINLQTVNIDTMPIIRNIRVIRQNYFDDTQQEEKNIFKLQKKHEKKRSGRVDYDRSYRNLLLQKFAANRGRKQGGKNRPIVFYLVEKIPVPLTPYSQVLRYPEAAANLSLPKIGIVVELIIDKKGRVIKATGVTDSGYGFEQEAISNLTNIRFRPGRLQGKTVAVLLRERFIYSQQ